MLENQEQVFKTCNNQMIYSCDAWYLMFIFISPNSSILPERIVNLSSFDSAKYSISDVVSI